MFDTIKRGFGFLGQALDMARKDGDLIKPSLYGMVAGTGITLILGVPFIGIALVVGDGDFGRAVMFVLGAGMIFVQYAVAYIFSGMTVSLIYGYLTEGDGQMEKAWAMVRRDWLDIFSLAAASTLVAIVRNLLSGRDRRGRRNPIGAMLGDLINRVWTTATYFVLPAMVIEDLSLGQALKRATYIIKSNLLLVAITEIGVGWVVGLIGFGLGFIAVMLGIAVFMIFSSLGSTGALIGLGAGVLVGGSLLALTSAFTSYVNTAYHTCMFLWAREAEKAVAAGQTVQSVRAPAPVAAVLGV